MTSKISTWYRIVWLKNILQSAINMLHFEVHEKPLAYLILPIGMQLTPVNSNHLTNYISCLVVAEGI